MAKVKFKVEGMKELQKSMKKLGDVPQKHVTASARKGMNIVLREARANAPRDTGNLKRGTILVGEKSRYKGKKIYRVVFDRKMNDTFQKPVVNPGKGRKNKAYYPVSQEYGFFTKNGRYIPGFRFVRDSLAENTQKVSQKIVDEMKKKIDAEIAKVGLK